MLLSLIDHCIFASGMKYFAYRSDFLVEDEAQKPMHFKNKVRSCDLNVQKGYGKIMHTNKFVLLTTVVEPGYIKIIP